MPLKVSRREEVQASKEQAIFRRAGMFEGDRLAHRTNKIAQNCRARKNYHSSMTMGDIAMADYFEEMGWQPLATGETPNFMLQMARLLRDFGMWDEMGYKERLPPPASKETVDNLTELEITKPDEKCPVCLKAFDVGESVKCLPCKHSFHSACILPWLAKTNTCPLCRHELPTDDEDYEAYRKEKARAKQREEDIENLHDSMFS